ncbi:MAG TPA: NB-ARC domain-containing protein [Vicinamibacterales bacterium]|nr:NB-ARC domain-containing protein [Vicinamibacterales bacterium]
MSRESSRHGAFISYARHDGEEIAHALHGRLAAEVPDVPAWLDRLELEGGIGWWKQIEEQLARAEFLLLIMTPAAVKSENTRREWRTARQLGVCVYPIAGAPGGQLDYASLPRWMGKAHFYDPQLEWEKLVAHLRRGCRATRVPFMAPPMPSDFIGRPRETASVIDLLVQRKSGSRTASTAALRGAGGFGKTTLATAVCYDDLVLDTFDDGILWVTLGQTPNILNELIKLHAALTGERPGFVDIEDAARELTLRLENKNCLLVIDDAWKSAHVAPFLRGAAGCARLITTRLFEVAVDASRVDVDQMDTGEATALLLSRAGITPIDEEPFRRLAKRLGGWPLPIKLVGSAMRQRIARGESPERALDYAVRSLEKRGITAFDKADAVERAEAVTRTLGASLDLLSPDDQRRCAELSIFPEDTAIPLSAAQALWRLDDIDSEDLARRLDDLALLEFDLRIGTLRMHDVLRSFLAERVADAPALHGALIDGWGDPFALTDAYAWRRYTFHLHRAGRIDAARALLLDPKWLAAKLRATTVQSLITDFEPMAGDRVLALIRGALRLSAPCLAVDPSQLRTQLTGRLLERDEPEIVRLRQALERSADEAWLTPLHPALDAPGGMLLMTLVGHEGGVTALSSAANDGPLVSASNDGSLRLWDWDHGQVLNELEHRTNLAAEAVATSRDGTIAVSGGADGLLYLWDLVRGERVDAFRAERGPAFKAVAISGDGRLVMSGSREETVRVWNVEARAWQTDLDGHRERVTAVALTHDGTRGVSASDDCTICVWDLRTGALERRIEGHAGPVNAVAMTGDGKWALSGSSDRTIKLWDLTTGACAQTMTGHESRVTTVAIAADAWRALSGSADQTARLWDLHSGQRLATLDGHSDAVTAVSIDASGTRAATGSADRAIKLWRLDDLRPFAPRPTHNGAVTTIVFNADGRLCASGGGDGRIIVREIESGRVLQTIDAHTAPVRSLAFTDDGACVLSSGVEHVYRMWNLDDGGGVWMPIRHAAPVDYCAMSARARHLITACSDRWVYVWEVPGGVLVERYGTRRLFDHLIDPSPRRGDLPDELFGDRYIQGEDVYDVALIRMASDGAHAVLSATLREAASERGESRRVRASRDGACLLVLDLRSTQVQSLTVRQTEPVVAFAIDEPATRLAWAQASHVINVWDLPGRAPLATMRGHSERINAVAFTRDGRFVVSCSRDRTLRVWDAATGQQVAAYTADAALRSLATAPSGSFVTAGDTSGRVHILRLDGIR